MPSPTDDLNSILYWSFTRTDSSPCLSPSSFS